MKTRESAAVAEKPKGRPRSFDRDQALVKALDLFWRKGYEPSSVAELCAAMEINPRACTQLSATRQNCSLKP